MFVLAVGRFQNPSYCNFESSASTVEIHFISKSISTSLLNLKGYSSLSCTISIGDGVITILYYTILYYTILYLRTMLYLMVLLSCGFSINFLIIVTQFFFNLVFNFLDT